MHSDEWNLYALALAGACFGCVDYNPAFEASFLSNAPEQSEEASGGVIPCSNPDEVHLLVENFSYIPQCGCEETQGNVCTTKVGMKVVWTFVDAINHNVTSVPNTFGGSNDTTAGGTYETTLSEPGEYPYGCTLHTEMRGYTIVAVAD